MIPEKGKNALLENLRRIPIVELACQKSGISRATFYRWKTEDKDFAQAVEEAMQEGKLLINDLSESQVISLVKDKNWQAISFWLKHHHPDYTNKVELMAKIKYTDETLTPEQEEIVRKALEFATLSSQSANNHGNQSKSQPGDDGENN